MITKDIQKIGRIAFTQSLHPLRRARIASTVVVVGIDTEFDSVTRELLCWTFSYQGNRAFYRVAEGEPFDWTKLENLVLGYLRSWGVSVNKRHCSAIKLICYFSIAESQHLADIMKSDVFETSVGVDFLWHGAGGRTFELVDLLKFFNNPPQKLSKVAESFGLKKLEWDRANISRADLDAPGFQPYAENDAYLAEEIFNKLRQAYVDEFKVDIILTKTPAQTSSSIFRLHYLDKDYTQPDIYLRRLGLLACWGGRNEAFRRGVFPTGSWFEYDAFSEYPNSVLQLGILPGQDDWIAAESVDELYSNPGIARVRFQFPPQTEFPCLPVFGEYIPGAPAKTGGKLFYPLSGESCCTNAEVRLAIDLGADITIVEAYYYQTGTDSLARFMSHFLAERQQAQLDGDLIRKHVIKLAINSFIGKLVQRVIKSDLNALVKLATLLEIPPHELRRFDPDSLRATCADLDFDFASLNRISVGNTFYPEWNALILGYARAATSRFIVTLARLGYKPGIASTDSVIFEKPARVADPMPVYNEAGIGFERREVGSHMSILRTRLYRLGSGPPQLEQDERGWLVDRAEKKIAHHAVARRVTALKLFDAWIKNPKLDVFDYEMTRIHTYRESVVYGKQYGATQFIPARHVKLGFDYKRELVRKETRPWTKLDRPTLVE